ncbi:CesT family type III secretion system chaperone [uncultured Succinivibrio sp.]|uniref:CesT family type III secretion system chaperone n=1 Tax=uncultured Succinivibrio sp. TaxID=540749 RepID=UPI0025E5AAB1|nr:CesT family type III secretion system chaperone [uncultured Succinivibrio sp.]
MFNRENNFVSLIDTLGSRLNISIILSQQNTCCLIFDRDPVNFEIRNNVLYIYAPIFSAENCDSKVLYGMLQENHLGDVFTSISPSTKDLCLNMVVTYECEYELFEKNLSFFVSKLRELKERVKGNSFDDNEEKNSSTHSVKDMIVTALPV